MRFTLNYVTVPLIYLLGVKAEDLEDTKLDYLKLKWVLEKCTEKVQNGCKFANEMQKWMQTNKKSSENNKF